MQLGLAGLNSSKDSALKRKEDLYFTRVYEISLRLVSM
jgi:hypothetical protein